MYIHIPRRVKYHDRKLNRLRHHDYSTPGYYFVTICTHFMVEWFGQIENQKMKLNECGEIVKQQWLWLEKQYSYIQLDIWVIMPNHFHGIITMKPNKLDPNSVGTGLDLSLRNYQKRLPLHNIIGAFKTTSSKFIHQQGLREFSWQRSYHDHIIKNESELTKIRRYILNNPKKWKK